MALYDTAQDYEAQRARTRLEFLIGKGRLVDLTDRSRRSTAQNSYMHVCIGIVAMETGYPMDYVKDEWFKKLVNPQTFRDGEIRDPYTGQTVTRWRSSASLSTEEMTLAIDRWRNWAARQGWYIPSPEEEAMIRQSAAEIDRQKQYL